MVLDAEKSGRISPGATLIEATSGNTGIGLAMAAAVKGYKMIITLPEKMSNEKVDVLKAFGAEVVRTPTEAAWDAPDSHIGIAVSMNKAIENSHILDQYSNPSNPLVHYDLTAEEIIDQSGGDLDYLFISVGTGGAVAGIARKFKERLPKCKVIGIDPIGSILAVPDSLNVPGKPYKIEGMGADFIPKVLDRSTIHAWVKTEDEESFYYSRRLIREEGLLVGGSAGSTLAGALRYCKENNLNENHKCCMVFSDSVRNYMTKFLSKDWMIENNFLSWEEYNDPKHILADKNVDALGLKPIKTFDDTVTVAQALEAFNSGQRTVPILKDGQVRCVVFQHKLLQAIVNKNLKQTDLANKGMTKDFVLVSYL
jgi:cystathionine beta-synthase